MHRFNLDGRSTGFGPGLAVCTAMAAVLLAGCAGKAPLASTGGAPVVAAAADAKGDPLLAKAEARVGKSPQNVSARVDLAQAYLAQGRFASAATTFEDAVSLGDASPRTGLGLALAYAGQGRNADALTTLAKWRDQIPAGDLGLALALAGQPDQGVAILTDVVRGGQATPKARQNLAYAYALAGRWGEARVIAAQDVPADQLDARLTEWASRARPEQGQARIAGLIGAPVRFDPGQPAALALNGAPATTAQPAFAAAEPVAEPAAAPDVAAAPAPQVELPAVQGGESFWGANQPEPAASTVAASAPQPAVVPAAFETSAPAVAQAPSAKFLSQPAVKPVAAASRTFADTFGDIADPARGGTTHIVQLGSFRTRAGAERAWHIFVARDPSLKNHALRITEADVRGRRYYRVAAEGFDRGTAQALCGTVKRRGQGCFAYAETRMLPGELPSIRDNGAKLARR